MSNHKTAYDVPDTSPEQFVFDEEQPSVSSCVDTGQKQEVVKPKMASFDVSGDSDVDDDTMFAPDDDGHAPAQHYDACDVGPTSGTAELTGAISIVTEEVRRVSLTREHADSIDYSALSPHTNVTRLRHPTDPGRVSQTGIYP